MERKKHSPQSILKITLGIAVGVWLMMCAPTGWIYDLWAGTGTGQGQTPDSSVSVVHTQADVEDGAYVCVYFDDYLMLRPGGELPTGYVRYATADEQKMLRGLEDSYEVNWMYVLDMYRHGKVNRILALAIRAGIGLLLLVVGSAIVGGMKKVIRRKAEEYTKR